MPIVEAVWSAANVTDSMGRRRRDREKRLEAVMAAALQAAHNEGITDPVALKERMMAAYRAERNK